MLVGLQHRSKKREKTGTCETIVSYSLFMSSGVFYLRHYFSGGVFPIAMKIAVRTNAALEQRRLLTYSLITRNSSSLNATVTGYSRLLDLATFPVDCIPRPSRWGSSSFLGAFDHESNSSYTAPFLCAVDVPRKVLLLVRTGRPFLTKSLAYFFMAALKTLNYS